MALDKKNDRDRTIRDRSDNEIANRSRTDKNATDKERTIRTKMSKKDIVKTYIIVIISILAGIALDQFTKWLAVRYLRGRGPYVLIENVFSLLYLENRGAAFGFLYGHLYILIPITTLILVGILWVYGRIPHEKKFIPMRICAVLLISGAIGNLMDRIIHGFVVDMFWFELINFPVFNVADIFVVIACIGFALLMIFYYKDEDLTAFQFKKRVNEESKKQ